MRPFVILALRRTGTKMLVSALGSHPDIPPVTHEFDGGLWRFLKHPYVLSNHRKWWMRWPIKVVHVYREDVVAGSLSMLLMSYSFTPGQFDVPVNEVQAVADMRNQMDMKFAKRAAWSVSYEQLCGGRDAVWLCWDFAERFCRFVGVPVRGLKTKAEKSAPMPPL